MRRGTLTERDGITARPGPLGDELLGDVKRCRVRAGMRRSKVIAFGSGAEDDLRDLRLPAVSPSAERAAAVPGDAAAGSATGAPSR
jgi:hypothetical protein